MIIYSDDSGAIVRVLFNEEQAVEFGAPANFAYALELDQDTNRAAAAAILNSTDNARLTGQTLTINGEAVAVNPAGETYTDRRAIVDFLPGIDAEIAALDSGITAYAGMTTTQKQTFVLNNFDRLMRQNRAILRAIRWIIKAYVRLAGV